MQLKRSIVQNTLKKCLSGVDKGSSIISGTDAFIFENGNVHVYNDAISVSIQNVFPEELAGAVKASDFMNVLNKLKGEELEIVVESDQWKMKCGRAKPTIKLMDAEATLNMIQAVSSFEGNYKTIPSNFVEGLTLCKMKNKSHFQGFMIAESDIFSTDGMSINQFTLSEEMDSFWITDVAGDELSKLSGLKEYFVSSGWVHFKSEDGVLFSCRVQDHASYPIDGLRRYVERFMDKTDVVQNKLPSEIGDVAERAASLAVDVSGALAVRLTFSKDEIEVYSERSTGSLTESIPLVTPFDEDPQIQVWLNSTFLKEAPGKVEDFHITNVDGAYTLVFYNENYVQAAKTLKLSK